MDLSSVRALDDFPKTPYKEQISVTSLRFRWIHGQCFQFQLPGGKVLMTDPFFPQHPKAWKRENTPLPDMDKLGQVDYVTINHAHFDHTAGLPDVLLRNRPTVICDRIFARELSAAYQIPEYHIFPIVPGMTYQFPDFWLDTVVGKHGDLGTVCDLDGGELADPDLPMSGPLNSYGCLFNTNYLFTLKNHFRICFAAGVDVDTTAEAWCNQGAELLLRQRMRCAKPEEFVQDCKKLGGQIVLPMHHDACDETNTDMNGYTERVNQILEKENAPMRMLNPKRLKWYTVRTEIWPD